MNILTPDRGYIPLEEIQIGDKVSAFDVFTGEKIENEVLEKTLWTECAESPFFNGKFYLINDTWKCYSEQSIWRNDNQVVHIQNLEIGDVVFNDKDEDVIVESIVETTDKEWYRFEISGDHSFIVDGLTLHNASRFWVGGTGTWSSSNTANWSATSGGASGASVPVAADTATIDASSGAGTVTPNYDFSITTLTCGAMGMTLDFSANNNNPTMSTFVGTGTGIRTINMGTGTFTLTGNNGNIWSFGTSTNLTFNPSTSVVDCTYSGSTGTRSIVGASSGGNSPNFKISAGTDSVSMATLSGAPAGYIDWTGFSGSAASAASAPAFTGSYTNSSTMTYATSSQTFNYLGTGTAIFTTNGVTLTGTRGLTINGTGTLRFADNITLGGAITLTQGTLDAATNNVNITCSTFSSSNSNTRTLSMGTGTWTLTGNNATIWTTNTSTNLTINANTSTVNCNYSGSTGTRTLAMTVRVNNVNITAGSDTVSNSGILCNSLNFTGFSGTFAGASTLNLAGSLTLVSGMTSTHTGATTFSATSGTNTITSAGITLDMSITFNGVGGTWQLADNLTVGTSRTVTLTNGILDANGKNFSMGLFSSSNSNTRSILMGSGTWTLTGTGTVWTTSTSTNLTLTPDGSTIEINDTSVTSKTFTGGGKTFGNITFSGDNIIVVNNNTFNQFRLANAGLTTGLLLTAGTTQTVNGFSNNGTAGNLTKLLSTSAGTPATLSKSSGNVSTNYMSIKDSTATGGAVWYAGANSTDVSGNTGWIFSNAPSGGSTIGNNLPNSIANAVMV